MDPQYKEWLEHPVTAAVLKGLEIECMERAQTACDVFMDQPLDVPINTVAEVYYALALRFVAEAIKEGGLYVATQ
jgi:hypothetical protein